MSTISIRQAGLLSVSLLISSLGCANAMEPTRAIRAPNYATPAEMKSVAREYRELYVGKKKQGRPGELLRDPVAHAKWVDLNWRLARTIDSNPTIGDMTEFGLKRQEDGSYYVELKEHPFWASPAEFLVRLRNRGKFESIAPDLKDRGFRDSDIALVTNYLNSNNPDDGARMRKAAITESFAALVQSRKRAGARVAEAETLSFMYEQARHTSEAQRAWAVGLLDTLDHQRQRILLSYIEEQDITRVYGRTADSAKAHADLVDIFGSGKYRELMEREIKE